MSQHFVQHVIDYKPYDFSPHLTAWIFKIRFNIIFSIYGYIVPLHVTTKVILGVSHFSDKYSPISSFKRRRKEKSMKSRDLGIDGKMMLTWIYKKQGMGCLQLPQDRILWINFESLKRGNFMTSWAALLFSRSMLHTADISWSPTLACQDSTLE